MDCYEKMMIVRKKIEYQSEMLQTELERVRVAHVENKKLFRLISFLQDLQGELQRITTSSHIINLQEQMIEQNCLVYASVLGEHLDGLCDIISSTQQFRDSLRFEDENRPKPDDECIICSQTFKESDSKEEGGKGERVFLRECGHDRFHHQCILEWLKQKPECPLCKVAVDHRRIIHS